MNVLIIGSGGREHAFAWKIRQSPLCDQLYVATGNAGTAQVAQNIDLNIDDFEQVGTWANQNHIDLILVGPEAPLVAGIADYFAQNYPKIKFIGAKKAGAMLEGSKDFSKKFMLKHQIPTAQAQTFDKDSLHKGFEFLTNLQPPYVLKADGLAAGKGVLITESLQEAQQNLEEMLNGKFGEASQKVLIEEFLDGIELSVFVLTDGENYVLLPSAKDYKRIGEADTGLNTGGMGAISPVRFATDEFMEKVENRIVKPTLAGLKAENIDYVGFIFVGLIKVGNDPYVIEYNARMGDPETEVVLPRIESDLLEILDLTAQKRLSEAKLVISQKRAATVMLVSGGYPEAYEKNKVISGLDKIGDVLAFHAGTQLLDGQVVTSGGRVIALTGFEEFIPEALEKVYEIAEIVDFDKKYYRKDIGFDLS